MAGAFTTSEVQYQIVRGSEFSRDGSPFMLENFLEAEVEEPPVDKVDILEDAFLRLFPKHTEQDLISQDEMLLKVLRDDQVMTAWEVCEEMARFITSNAPAFTPADSERAADDKEWRGTRTQWVNWMNDFEAERTEVAEKDTWTANSVIHEAIDRYFKPDAPPKFWHNGKEWLSRCEGRGTRKRAAAHAVLLRGTGVFRVNGEQDMYHRWPQIYHRIDVCQPFKLTGTAGIYDVFVSVRGGGLSGQAGATRLAVARALFQANPACHDDLQKGFCLLEDTRQKWSKMAGKPGAQSSYTWNKR